MYIKQNLNLSKPELATPYGIIIIITRRHKRIDKLLNLPQIITSDISQSSL